MNRLLLFLLLTGSLFILIGFSGSSKVQNSKEVKSSKVVQVPPSPVQSSNPEQIFSQALVTKIVDGDTIDVQVDGKKDVIRLIGINAPETGECFGKEATERAKEVLSSKNVNLEADPTQGERDKYKRLLRYVFVDGKNFDELMVREGFAKEYTYKTVYKYQSLFKTAQKEAQDNKRGLWADGACSKTSIIEQKPASSSSTNQNFTCDCSKLCSQIATCEEAYFQLNNCGCTARDSDHDGIPCESLCK